MEPEGSEGTCLYLWVLKVVLNRAEKLTTKTERQPQRDGGLLFLWLNRRNFQDGGMGSEVEAEGEILELTPRILNATAPEPVFF
ncbi:MAG: hypothetical protein RLZZ435_2878 [Cyanobacteriota bacterium]